MNNFWIQFAASQMQMVGQMLIGRDANTTGSDDMVGKLLSLGSSALSQFFSGNIRGFNGSLKAIRDAIDTYLATAAE